MFNGLACMSGICAVQKIIHVNRTLNQETESWRRDKVKGENPSKVVDTINVEFLIMKW